MEIDWQFAYLLNDGFTGFFLHGKHCIENGFLLINIQMSEQNVFAHSITQLFLSLIVFWNHNFDIVGCLIFVWYLKT